ncbi:hypothetical protein F4804DRAFT_338771 [Jackrogersella minutella]|nr:hypothetical protein F4804DRAFT_338771 [Jackrogersella minutella]
MLSGSRSRFRSACVLISIFLVTLILLQRGGTIYRAAANLKYPIASGATTANSTRHRETEIVVASTKREDASWIYRHFAHWNPQVYIADDRYALLRVPKNKGREAMVYLTYIIDNYDNLPDTAIFIHASRFQWHNDDPNYDTIPTLRNLRLPYVREAGYVNLRCTWVVGCPAEIRPFEDEDAAQRANGERKQPSAKTIFRQAFEQLLPEVPVPPLVAVSCCSQFAVAGPTIRRHPKERYVRFRDWLLDTPLDDSLSGRVMEFSWHIIFGKEAVHCPTAKECYCNVFGLCELPCNEFSCDGRYILPPFATLPPEWPRLGWNNEDRGYNETLD